jgi:enoyl-[acyl-carrier protein] reductase I
MGLLDGKKGLILNIANDRSIAWHIGHNAIQHGAECGFGYLVMGDADKSLRRAKKSLEDIGAKGGADSIFLHTCDVGSDESMAAYFAAAKAKFGQIDFLVHSLAFANKDYLKKEQGVFTNTPREVYSQACDISAYSLIALTRHALPLMPNGGSVVAMSYYGAEKVIPGYNVMGVAKAALESTARYLAYDLGEKKIRVNCISAGPIRTLAAMGVGGIDEMLEYTPKKAPLKRNIDADEVGKTAVYLLSDLSSGTTGETIYVDAGFNNVGL